MSRTVSSIVPKGSELVNVRNNQFALSSIFLEVFEICAGIIIISFILGSQLKKARAPKK